ncbi:hypothetical protein [Breoghania sp.]|uniref:hypothetical protein n=1 Tax=Breoghania sp. TaxID=2065378 RepID=UPI0029CA8C00|nr:hypothetical protein [Breoghania sp.]
MSALHLLGRLFAILFGYCLAIVAASLFLTFYVPGWAPVEWISQHWAMGPDFFVYGYRTSPDMAETIDRVARVTMGLMSASAVGAMAFVPAGLCIVASEALRLRSAIFHVLAGGGISLALLAVTFMPASGPARLPDDWNLFLAAGFIGGVVYWLIAGRGAGIVGPSVPPDQA